MWYVATYTILIVSALIWLTLFIRGIVRLRNERKLRMPHRAENNPADGRRCPMCGTSATDDSLRCLSCGEEFGRAPEAN